MSIEVRCACGKRLSVADEHAGKRGRCPDCGAVLTIPASGSGAGGSASSAGGAAARPLRGQQLSSIAAAAAGRKPPGRVCNSCGQAMGADAVICTNCGFHRIAGTFVKQATHAEKEKKEKRPLLTVAGVDIMWLRLVLVVVPVIVLVIWWFTGPARPVHITGIQRVYVVDALHGGATREPYSLYTGTGDRSLGIKGAQSKSNPNPVISSVSEVYSLGNNDELIVTRPAPNGDYIIVEIALKQGVVRDAGQTFGYESRFSFNQFKLVPADGGDPIETRLLYTSFDQQVNVDLAGADTNSYKALYPPITPNDEDIEKEQGTLTGSARWDRPQVKGEISFMSSYPYMDFPGSTGLSAEGQITLTHPDGMEVDLDYRGGSMDATWPSDATGWWGKQTFGQHSDISPWYRYRFGLLFKRPANAEKLKLLYCDKPLATVDLTDAVITPHSRPTAQQPTTPATAQAPAQAPAQPQQKKTDVLSYFEVLAESRKKARGVVSSSNMRQIGIGLEMYLDRYNEWPDRLQRLREVMNVDSMMLNPRTGEKPGFIYEQPPPGAPPASTAVLWESIQDQKDPDGAVLYADGHIEQP